MRNRFRSSLSASKACAQHVLVVFAVSSMPPTEQSHDVHHRTATFVVDRVLLMSRSDRWGLSCSCCCCCWWWWWWLCRFRHVSRNHHQADFYHREIFYMLPARELDRSMNARPCFRQTEIITLCQWRSHWRVWRFEYPLVHRATTTWMYAILRELEGLSSAGPICRKCTDFNVTFRKFS